MTRHQFTPTEQRKLASTMLLEFHPGATPADRQFTVQLGADVFDDTGEGTLFDAILIHDHESDLIYTASIKAHALDACATGCEDAILDSVAVAPVDPTDDPTIDDESADEYAAAERALAAANAHANAPALWQTYASSTAPSRTRTSEIVLPSTLPSTFATLKELP